MAESIKDKVGEIYKRIRRELLLFPLRANLVPVHIVGENNVWQGSGTLVLDNSGNHKHILTASHLFPLGQQQRYCYQILQPFSDVGFPIQSAVHRENTREDVAICIPGPTRTIVGFSHYKGGLNAIASYQGWPMKLPHPTCTSLVSGKTVAVGGILEHPDLGRYYVLDYAEGFFGESGMGFLATNPKELLVLRGGFPAPEAMKRDFALTSKHLCFASLITL